MSFTVFARWARIARRAPSASPPPRGAHPAARPQEVHYGIEQRQEHPVARPPREQRVKLDVGVNVPLGRVDGAAAPSPQSIVIPIIKPVNGGALCGSLQPDGRGRSKRAMLLLPVTAALLTEG